MVDAYVERLGIQYRDKPNARALCALFVQAALADGVPLQLSDAFDLTKAVGPQLDILGKYIGSTRSVLTTLNTAYFGFVLDDGSSTNTNGFQDDNAGYPQGFDDLTSYARGATLAALNGGSGWNGDGTLTVPETTGQDDLTSYSVGTISTLNGGTGWGADGTLTVPN
ncbi:MAG: DUF2612 domain-containing protein [Polyangia bacterium]